MSLFDKQKNKIIEIFFPWIILRKKDLKIRKLRDKLEKLTKDYKKKYKHTDKIFSNLNIEFEKSLENYLNNSMNYVSFNSEKIIDHIKENLIIPERLIDKKINNHESIVSYETIKFKSRFYGNNKNKNLIIFISGNEPTHPGQKESVKKIMNDSDDYDALYLSIFNRGLNLEYRSEISFNGLQQNFNSNLLDNTILKNNNILNLYQGDNSKINPMSLFLSGNYYLIKDIISKKKYNQIILAGMSAGTVPTIFYGALFEEIDSILTFDGVVPLTSHFFSSNIEKNFYYFDNWFLKEYDYDILYFITLLNKKKKRNLFMFYTDLYWNKNKEVLKNLMDKFNFKNFIMKNNLRYHDFDENKILELIKKNN
jgi:hypothetical protein